MARPHHQQKTNFRQVPGIHAAREVLKVRPRSVKEIWLQQGYERNQDLRAFEDWSKKHRVKLQLKPDALLRKITEHHQGVCVLTDQTPELDLQSLKNAQYSRLVVLDGVTDPHNLGAVLRTAWLFQADAVLLPENRSVSLTPTAIKVASGGAEHVPIYSEGNLVRTLEILKEQGFWVFGFDHEARQNLAQTKFPEKAVLILGAEDRGMRSTVRNICDELIKIPQADAEASFNVSVAAAIGLYEVHRQHQNPLK